MKAKLTSKGQITIPTAIRRRLGLQVGQVLKVDEEAPYILAVPVFDEEAMRAVVLRKGRRHPCASIGLKPLAMPTSLRDFGDLGSRFPGAEAPGSMPMPLRGASRNAPFETSSVKLSSKDFDQLSMMQQLGLLPAGK
jgi:AbrB family looped-hinge helix DNA binding protein